ncbi:riboflavin synthase subunit beta [uncultured Dokdonia sp.]|uniref:riboflavin synthase subunit beta n=1 Tax=uncultured Dokdonia sp. TaxID=575653 RepID=UPI002617F4A2|nr:riboflavin synthase subunit beta [uncultured Dokdonia sp.]
MGILKRTNKKFEYTPRYYKSDKEGSPFKMEGKFDEYRSTLNVSRGLKGKLQTAWDELQESRKNGYNRTIIFLVLLFIFLFLWIIDFDLSIFSGT